MPKRLPRPRASVFSTEVYQPGRPIEEVLAEFGLKSAHKLASNENLFGVSERAREAAHQALDGVNYYPDTNGVLLRRELAARLGVAPEEVRLGNGTVELIYDLIRAYSGPGTSVVAGKPSFSAYPVATRLVGGEAIEVPNRMPGNALDLEGLVAAVRDDTTLLFLPNPNNPTGTLYTRAELDALLGRVPDGVLVVLDEAYHDYIDHPEYPDSVALLKAGAPVCILRSLSKSLGIAGLRIGYGVFPAEVSAVLRQVQLPFHTSVPAQAAARAGLEDQDFLRRTRDQLAAAREHLYRGLEARGLEFVRSHANFVLIRMDRPVRPLARAMMARGVIVRPGEDLGAAGWLRVTVGPEPVLDDFLEALDAVLQEDGDEGGRGSLRA